MHRCLESRDSHAPIGVRAVDDVARRRRMGALAARQPSSRYGIFERIDDRRGEPRVADVQKEQQARRAPRGSRPRAAPRGPPAAPPEWRRSRPDIARRGAWARRTPPASTRACAATRSRHSTAAAWAARASADARNGRSTESVNDVWRCRRRQDLAQIRDLRAVRAVDGDDAVAVAGAAASPSRRRRPSRVIVCCLWNSNVDAPQRVGAVAHESGVKAARGLRPCNQL